MSETHENDDEIEVRGRLSHCYACGEELHLSSILICAECLHDECDEFVKATTSTESSGNDK